jgi:hypothetical protein
VAGLVRFARALYMTRRDACGCITANCICPSAVFDAERRLWLVKYAVFDLWLIKYAVFDAERRLWLVRAQTIK